MKLHFMESAAPPKIKSQPRRNGTPNRAAVSAEGTAYSVPAVGKALDVLELLGGSSQGMSLTRIAEALGRTKQELFRVLLCLQERGYLVRDDAQVYRLSTKLFEIGSQHASTQTLIARATPHMERLARQLRESCHLNIVVQNRMLVVARAEGDADVMLAVRIGATFEMHTRVSGRVALALLPGYRRQEYWKQSGEPAASVRTWESRLERIRRRGYADEDSPIVQGVRDCAAGVLGGGGSLLGVLCVSHLCRKDEPAEHADIAGAVLECARDIAAEFHPDRPSADRADRADRAEVV
jgi:DNA-binding IclR family transcriptional regulator